MANPQSQIQSLPAGAATSEDSAYRSSLSRLSGLLSQHHSSTSGATRHSSSYLHLSRTLGELVSVPVTGTSSQSPAPLAARGATYRLTSAVTSLSSAVYELESIQGKFDAARDCGPSILRIEEGLKTRTVAAAAASSVGVATATAPSTPPRRPSSAAPCVAIPSGPALAALDVLIRSPALEASRAAAAGGAGALTERDVHAAADAAEALRDAHRYFTSTGGASRYDRFRSAAVAAEELASVHRRGVAAMCGLVALHLDSAGAAVRTKVVGAVSRPAEGGRGGGRSVGFSDAAHASPAAAGPTRDPGTETSAQVRLRLSSGLTNRDLMKSVGEYADRMPLDVRAVRELRAIFECLSGGAHALYGAPVPTDTTQAAEDALCRSERSGGGGSGGLSGFSRLSRRPLSTGHPHVDAFGTARRAAVSDAMAKYHRGLRRERTKRRQEEVLAAHNVSPAASTMDDPKRPAGTQWEDNAPADLAAADAVGAAEPIAEGAARDAVRCLEHAMVGIQGERSIYRTIFGGRGDYGGGSSVASTSGAASPSAGSSVGGGNRSIDGASAGGGTSPAQGQDQGMAGYRRALLAMYSHIVSGAVDRATEIIEQAFLKECRLESNATGVNSALLQPDAQGGVGMAGDATANSFSGAPVLPVGEVSAAAAAALRIVDGVRILCPSLSKLCDVSSYVTGSAGGGLTTSFTGRSSVSSVRGDANHTIPTVAGSLCISLHRGTVKSCAKCLENLARSVARQGLSGDGVGTAPLVAGAVVPSVVRDSAGVAMISSNVVKAVRTLAPFTNAYNSVSKRRQLTWDDQMGEKAGGMNRFVRYIIVKLLQNLQSKTKQCVKQETGAELKCHIFLINNAEYLYDQIGPDSGPLNTTDVNVDDEPYEITGTWFQDTVGLLMEKEKKAYLASSWHPLLKHLTTVDKNELSYQNENSKLLSLETGRLLKARFRGFSDEFEHNIACHRRLQIYNSHLRRRMIADIKQVIMPRYTRFFEKYSKIKFSKKNTEEYLKYPPVRVEYMVDNLFTASSSDLIF
eukprot:CAMPEP_0194289944 /NCGR_PEP_ID=MMETSP0169-20130528/40227_1 /TAXON_ID=218684 /ORGANISM="Corethron pennatum, Strain L29A3" /LENGTH=1028 /DNA_ID=CAMNT_0039037377 /DNA_START=110 /DNA_END=3196 /DNA_ORIENTATION=+